ncbi:hypothetical protein RRG08_004918 [Elysia crispata]|uniref:Uncharacterized protein n=1 Tax=Elysia crispata TaxID=231223 RepID=A0AAE1DGG5_9GAST|nr:hypothetical protein RRG08_004918 [Elysia crispata]
MENLPHPTIYDATLWESVKPVKVVLRLMAYRGRFSELCAPPTAWWASHIDHPHPVSRGGRQGAGRREISRSAPVLRSPCHLAKSLT